MKTCWDVDENRTAEDLQADHNAFLPFAIALMKVPKTNHKRICVEEEFLGRQVYRRLMNAASHFGRTVSASFPDTDIVIQGMENITLYTGTVRLHKKTVPVWSYFNDPIVVWSVGEPPEYFEAYAKDES